MEAAAGAGAAPPGCAGAGASARAVAAGARRKCARACGRSSSPSTASTMPSSSAGICRPPSRYRCSTVACLATGPGERTRRSLAPNVADRAASVPRTVTRRAPASAPVTRRPCPASTLVMSDRSAGSVPYCPANCSGVRVAGPSTRSRGSAARRRVTSVTSISSESSTAPSSCDPGSEPRSLPGKGTKECPVMIAPILAGACAGYCLAGWCGRRRFRSQYVAGPGAGEPFRPQNG